LNLNLIAAYDDDDDECFPTKTPGFGGKKRAMNILAGNKHFNRRSQLCAFCREMVLAGNVRDKHFLTGNYRLEMCILTGKFWRENMAMLHMYVDFGGQTSTEVVNMTSL